MVEIWIWTTYSLNSLEVVVEVEVVVVVSNSILGEVQEVVVDNSNKKKFLFFSRTLMSFLLI